MKLEDFKKEMMKNPEFKREYERFDLVFWLKKSYTKAGIKVLSHWQKLRKEQ